MRASLAGEHGDSHRLTLIQGLMSALVKHHGPWLGMAELGGRGGPPSVPRETAPVTRRHATVPARGLHHCAGSWPAGGAEAMDTVSCVCGRTVGAAKPQSPGVKGSPCHGHSLSKSQDGEYLDFINYYKEFNLSPNKLV